jgi:hypothetical protein
MLVDPCRYTAVGSHAAFVFTQALRSNKIQINAHQQVSTDVSFHTAQQ